MTLQNERCCIVTELFVSFGTDFLKIIIIIIITFDKNTNGFCFAEISRNDEFKALEKNIFVQTNFKYHKFRTQ